MQVLVIGGAGYIGSHVVRRFLDAGHRVHVLDNMYSGREENLFPEAGFTRGDILEYGPLATLMQQGWDAVVHLAAYKAAGESMVNRWFGPRNTRSTTSAEPSTFSTQWVRRE